MVMKEIGALLVGLLAIMSLTGCSEKKNDNVIIARKVVKKAPSSPIRMQDYTQTKNVDFAGSRLKCVIQRTPCDSLTMVKDENGQKYVDNTILLTITRANGSIFFKRTFTKKSFTDCLDKDYNETGILEGFVFDKIDGGNLCFAASVCHPQDDDEFIPLVVKITQSGAISIERDTQIDTNGTVSDDDDSN